MLSIFTCFLIDCKARQTKKYLNIEIYDWHGKKHKLKDYNGKLVVLEFWASWCEPCKKAAPIVDKVRLHTQKQNVIFLGVNTDHNKTLAEIKQTAKLFGMKYISLLDPTMELTDSLEVEGLPALIILDSKGNVIHKQYGVLSSDFYKLVNLITINDK